MSQTLQAAPLKAWSGKTSNVSLDRKYNGTLLKTCLQATVKRWRFPEFSGKSIPVEFPLIFQASM